MDRSRPYRGPAVVLLTLLGAACATGPECIEVEGGYRSADPAYVVGLKEGVPVRETTEELARRHEFTVTTIRDEDYVSTKGFTVDRLSKKAFDGLRCERVVRTMYHNGRVAPLQA